MNVRLWSYQPPVFNEYHMLCTFNCLGHSPTPCQIRNVQQVAYSNLPAIVMTVYEKLDLRVMTHRGKGVVSMQLGLEVVFTLFLCLLMLFSGMEEMDELVSNLCAKVAYECDKTRSARHVAVFEGAKKKVEAQIQKGVFIQLVVQCNVTQRQHNS